MKNKVTMQTIADKMKVSKVTVYKALNSKTDISPTLRDKIIQKSIELGYDKISPLAKNSRLFYYFIPKQFNNSTEQYYSGIFNKLASNLASMNITLEWKVIDDNFSVEKFVKQHERFKENFGVFLAGVTNRQILQDFEQSSIPCVVIDAISDTIKLNYIFVDNYRSGYKLTNYLIETGHKSLCALIKTSKSSSNLDKYYGFRKSLTKNNIQFTPEMFLDLDIAQSEDLAKFKLPEKLPDAYIFESDFAAYSFYIYAAAHGINIPEDVSVASFDNTRRSLEMNPTLTSIGPDTDDLANACYDMMLNAYSLPTHHARITTMHSVLHQRNSVKVRN